MKQIHNVTMKISHIFPKIKNIKKVEIDPPFVNFPVRIHGSFPDNRYLLHEPNIDYEKLSILSIAPNDLKCIGKFVILDKNFLHSSLNAHFQKKTRHTYNFVLNLHQDLELCH